MMKSKHYLHGGDLDTVVRETGFKREELIDFSGNINPFGISPEAKETIRANTHLISTYPDRYYRELRAVVGAYCGTHSANIIVGNGCSELIALTIGTLRPKRTLVLAPTYSEYEREIQAIGGEIDYYLLRETSDFEFNIDHFLQALNNQYELVIICNPNNPTSTAIKSTDLDRITNHCKESNTFVMIDETYIEFCDEIEEICAIPLVEKHKNLMVLRGISKFFSAPGLRFGYGIISDVELRQQLLKKQIPWSVNSLAEIAVVAMLEDRHYIRKTHEYFVEERKRTIEALKQVPGIHMYVPKANFILLKLENKEITSERICEEFLRQGMMVRDASSFVSLDSRYIRFCLLDKLSNDKFINHLYKVLGMSDNK